MSSIILEGDGTLGSHVLHFMAEAFFASLYINHLKACVVHTPSANTYLSFDSIDISFAENP